MPGNAGWVPSAPSVSVSYQSPPALQTQSYQSQHAVQSPTQARAAPPTQERPAAELAVVPPPPYSQPRAPRVSRLESDTTVPPRRENPAAVMAEQMSYADATSLLNVVARPPWFRHLDTGLRPRFAPVTRVTDRGEDQVLGLGTPVVHVASRGIPFWTRGARDTYARIPSQSPWVTTDNARAGGAPVQHEAQEAELKLLVHQELETAVLSALKGISDSLTTRMQAIYMIVTTQVMSDQGASPQNLARLRDTIAEVIQALHTCNLQAHMQVQLEAVQPQVFSRMRQIIHGRSYADRMQLLNDFVLYQLRSDESFNLSERGTEIIEEIRQAFIDNGLELPPYPNFGPPEADYNMGENTMGKRALGRWRAPEQEERANVAAIGVNVPMWSQVQLDTHGPLQPPREQHEYQPLMEHPLEHRSFAEPQPRYRQREDVQRDIRYPDQHQSERDYHQDAGYHSSGRPPQRFSRSRSQARSEVPSNREQSQGRDPWIRAPSMTPQERLAYKQLKRQQRDRLYVSVPLSLTQKKWAEDHNMPLAQVRRRFSIEAERGLLTRWIRWIERAWTTPKYIRRPADRENDWAKFYPYQNENFERAHRNNPRLAEPADDREPTVMPQAHRVLFEEGNPLLDEAPPAGTLTRERPVGMDVEQDPTVRVDTGEGLHTTDYESDPRENENGEYDNSPAFLRARRARAHNRKERDLERRAQRGFSRWPPKRGRQPPRDEFSRGSDEAQMQS